MSLSHLLPLAAPAIGSLASDTVETIADGLSFAQVLLQPRAKADEQVATDTKFVSVNDSDAALRSVRGTTEEVLKHFREAILGKLKEAGIDTSHPIRLRGDGQGGVIVDGDHPQRAAIEQIIREDTSLTGLFNYLSANYGLLNSQGKNHANAGDDRFLALPHLNGIDDADRFELTIDAGRIEVSISD